MDMSPVPGGRSTSRKSGSFQATSVRNCSRALWSMGPRQITAWFSSAKNPMEMHRTPWASGGTIISPTICGSWSMPNIRGTEKPHTSASTTAVRCPAAANATPRFTVIDDFPTPPLPEAMSITRVVDVGSVKGMVRGGAAGVSPAGAMPVDYGIDSEIPVP